MIVQCCVCHRVRDEGDWVESLAVLDQSKISHGYCPRCAAQAYEQVRQHLREVKGIDLPTYDEEAARLRQAI